MVFIFATTMRAQVKMYGPSKKRLGVFSELMASFFLLLVLALRIAEKPRPVQDRYHFQ
jgi:hypothetical protein